MVNLSEEDTAVSQPGLGPLWKPTNERRSPFGRRLGEIRARGRQSRPHGEYDSEEWAQREEDIYQKLTLISKELAAVADVLSSYNMIDSDGYSNDGGQGGGQGNTQRPPTDLPFDISRLISLAQWMLFQINSIWTMIRNINFIIGVLLKNKELGPQNQGAGGLGGQVNQKMTMFDQGRFFGSMTLDKDAWIGMTIPGTNTNGGWLAEFPAASKAWMNRMYGDLTNGRIHAVTSQGSWTSFFNVGEAGIKYNSVANAYQRDDPGGHDPDFWLGDPSGATYWVLPKTRPTGSSKLLRGKTDGTTEWVVGGVGAAPTVVSKTANYTASDTDGVILCDASGGAFTVTLSATTSGREHVVKKTDSSANAVTVSPPTGNIDGSSSASLASQYDSIKMVSDGTDWWIV